MSAGLNDGQRAERDGRGAGGRPDPLRGRLRGREPTVGATRPAAGSGGSSRRVPTTATASSTASPTAIGGGAARRRAAPASRRPPARRGPSRRRPRHAPRRRPPRSRRARRPSGRRRRGSGRWGGRARPGASPAAANVRNPAVQSSPRPSQRTATRSRSSRLRQRQTTIAPTSSDARAGRRSGASVRSPVSGQLTTRARITIARTGGDRSVGSPPARSQSSAAFVSEKPGRRLVDRERDVRQGDDPEPGQAGREDGRGGPDPARAGGRRR